MGLTAPVSLTCRKKCCFVIYTVSHWMLSQVHIIPFIPVSFVLTCRSLAVARMSSAGDMTADSDSPPSCSQLSSSDDEVSRPILSFVQYDILVKSFLSIDAYRFHI